MLLLRYAQYTNKGSSCKADGRLQMNRSGERIVVTIGAVKPKYKAAALPGGQPNKPPKLVFVRKTTMRDQGLSSPWVTS